jgi:hypothetical protein
MDTLNADLRGIIDESIFQRSFMIHREIQCTVLRQFQAFWDKMVPRYPGADGRIRREASSITRRTFLQEGAPKVLKGKWLQSMENLPTIDMELFYKRTETDAFIRLWDKLLTMGLPPYTQTGRRVHCNGGISWLNRTFYIYRQRFDPLSFNQQVYSYDVSDGTWGGTSENVRMTEEEAAIRMHAQLWEWYNE